MDIVVITDVAVIVVVIVATVVTCSCFYRHRPAHTLQAQALS